METLEEAKAFIKKKYKLNDKGVEIYCEMIKRNYNKEYYQNLKSIFENTPNNEETLNGINAYIIIGENELERAEERNQERNQARVEVEEREEENIEETNSDMTPEELRRIENNLQNWSNNQKEYYKQDQKDKMYGNREKADKYKKYLSILNDSIEEKEFVIKNYDGTPKVDSEGNEQIGRYKTMNHLKFQNKLDEQDLGISVEDALKLLQLEEYTERLERKTKLEAGDRETVKSYLTEQEQDDLTYEERLELIRQRLRQDSIYLTTNHLSSNTHEFMGEAIGNSGGLTEYKNGRTKIRDKEGFWNKLKGVGDNYKSLIGVRSLKDLESVKGKIGLGIMNTVLIALSPVSLTTKLLYRHTPFVGKEAQKRRYLKKHADENSSPYDGRKTARKVARQEKYREEMDGKLKGARSFVKATNDDLFKRKRRNETEQKIMDEHFDENIEPSIENKKEYKKFLVTGANGALISDLQRDFIYPIGNNVVNTDSVGRKNRERAINADVKKRNYVPYTITSSLVGLSVKQLISLFNNQPIETEKIPSSHTERKIVGYEKISHETDKIKIEGMPETPNDFATAFDGKKGDVFYSVNGGEVDGWKNAMYNNLNHTTGVAYKIELPDGRIFEDEFASMVNNNQYDYLGTLLNESGLTKEQLAQYVTINGEIKGDSNVFDMISNIIKNKKGINMSPEQIKESVMNNNSDVYAQLVTKEGSQYGGWVDITTGQKITSEQVIETLKGDPIYKDVIVEQIKNGSNVKVTNNMIDRLKNIGIAIIPGGIESVITTARKKESNRSGPEKFSNSERRGRDSGDER